MSLNSIAPFSFIRRVRPLSTCFVDTLKVLGKHPLGADQIVVADVFEQLFVGAVSLFHYGNEKRQAQYQSSGWSSGGQPMHSV
jgi:hypothetical protein